jgi:hypothetical protein
MMKFILPLIIVMVPRTQLMRAPPHTFPQVSPKFFLSFRRKETIIIIHEQLRREGGGSHPSIDPDRYKRKKDFYFLKMEIPYPEIRQSAALGVEIQPFLSADLAVVVCVSQLEDLARHLVALLARHVGRSAFAKAVRAQDLLGCPGARVVVVVQREEGCGVIADDMMLLCMKKKE